MGVPSNIAIANFSAGQLGVSMRARFELPFYLSGSELSQNFIPSLQGPTRYREGFKHVNATDEISVLVPFVFSSDQSYMLEFTHRRVRVYKDKELLMAPVGVGPITNAIDHPSVVNTCQITLAAHGLADWDEVIISGMLNTTLNGRWYIRKEDANTFRINKKFTTSFIASPSSLVKKIAGCLTPYRAYDDGNPGTDEPSNIGEIEKPSQQGFSVFEHPEFLEMQVAQAFDTMYIVHKSAAPRKLVRTTNELVWTCATYSRTADPFPTSAKYPQAITFHEQRLVYGAPLDEPQKVLASKSGDFSNHTLGSNATDAWVFQGATRKRLNSIRALAGNDDFLVVGGSEGPDRMFGTGDAAITPTNVNIKSLDSLGVAAIQPAMIEQDVVYVQKDRKRIRAIRLSGDTRTYVPVDLTKASDEILNGKARQLAYQAANPNVLWVALDSGGLVALNLDSQENILAWHTHNSRPGDKVKSVAVRPVSNGYDELWAIWQRDINGTTTYFIEVMDLPKEYPRQEEYFTDDADADLETFQNAMSESLKQAYHLDCGASYFGDEDRPFRISLSANTGTITITAVNDQWVVGDVGRYLKGKDGVGLIRLSAYVDALHITAVVEEAFSSTLIQGGDYYITATTLTGLTHLEGEEVEVLADGAWLSPQTVTGGLITLADPATVIHVGFPYRGRIKTMNLESGGMNGPAQGKLKNVWKLVIKFIDTLGAAYGTNPYNMERIIDRGPNSQIGRPPPLFTGEREIPIQDTSATEKHVYIHQDAPYPCTVQMIEAFMTTAGD